MKYLINIVIALPLMALVIELIFLSQNTGQNIISPISQSNQYLAELTKVLQLSGLKYQQLNTFDHRSEAEFLITDPSSYTFKTIISLQKSPLTQVGALQKLIKIANIEDRQINIVNLSSNRPYATF